MPAAGRIAAVLDRQQQAMLLRVPAAPLPSDPISVTFFADHWGFIEHAAPQPWELDGGQLILTLTPGAAADSTAPTGILVVGSADGTRALRIDASANEASSSTDPQRASSAAESRDVSSAAPLALPTALLFALIGGTVLNLMPCVFPVLAIKALALAQHGGTALRHRALHSAAYTAGVLLLFTAVALLLLALRAGGAALGWGFQLQSPVFVVLMAYLFLTLGLSLAGAVTLGAGLMGVGQIGVGQIGVGQIGVTRTGTAGPGPQREYLGAFMTGALAALVAAPCTAPFMGAAVGYAVAQPWPIALAVIMTLGLGMALPFAALALSPALARRLPRPGRWMEYLKQFLAFPMFATAAWLLWVLSQQTGPAGVGAALAGAILLALALWLLEVTRAATGSWRRFGNGASLVSGLAALWLAVGLVPNQAALPSHAGSSSQRSTSGPAAEAFSAQRLADARAAGQPVFVNMTAAWCITCLVNERVALDRRDVISAFADGGVLYLKGDWTNRDAAITEYLADYGRNGVPLYVYYPPSSEPIVLPQVLSESVVLDVLR
jgi:thiol:disulfide interchange protein DsbD